MPGFVVVATYLNPDIPEAFFVSLAFWTFVVAVERPEKMMPWLILGIVTALAFLNRQTSLALAIFLAGMFIAKPMAPRSRYWIAAAAFLPVIAVEWLYLFLATGDPAYRASIDFHHDRVDRLADAELLAGRGGLIDSQGNLGVNVYLDPILSLFVTQKYGLLFWAFAAAVIAATRARTSDPKVRILFLAIGLGAISFLFVALNPRLYLVPRYLLVAAWAAALCVGWWLQTLWHENRRLALAATSAALIGVNAASLAVENTNPRFAERALVEVAQRFPDTYVYTDIETGSRAFGYLLFADVPLSRIRTSAPPDGALFLYSRVRVHECARVPRCRDRVQDFQPQPDWKVLEVVTPKPPAIARLLGPLGVDRYVHRDIARRLVAPNAPVTLYRTVRSSSRPG